MSERAANLISALHPRYLGMTADRLKYTVKWRTQNTPVQLQRAGFKIHN